MRVPEELPDEADRRVDVLLIEDVERDDRGLGAEDLAVGRVELREALLLRKEGGGADPVNPPSTAKFRRIATALTTGA